MSAPTPRPHRSGFKTTRALRAAAAAARVPLREARASNSNGGGQARQIACALLHESNPDAPIRALAERAGCHPTTAGKAVSKHYAMLVIDREYAAAFRLAQSLFSGRAA